MAQLGPGPLLLFKQPVQAGFRSPLPIPQLNGGASGQAGFISPLPTIPLGGNEAVSGGVRSLLAFWAGGATSGIAVEVIETETPGYYGTGYPHKRIKDDEEIIALIMAMYESNIFH